LVYGATQAFFSDTETSTGNTFTAGEIDLKIDHTLASYNGNDCSKNCVEDTSINLISNGSFENPEVTHSAKWEIFPSGTPGLVWTVEWSGTQTSYNSRTRPTPALVEYHEGVLGSAQEGDQYAELDSDWFGPSDSLNGEPALTKIYQNINTTVGAKYKLHYYFSPRPNTGAGENILSVEIDDVQVQAIGPLAGGGLIVWSEYIQEFTATNASTKIEFIGGGTDNSLGIFLDDISVHPYNCSYQIPGGTCALWPLKDLGNGDFIWNFNDVKPGDYGRDVISYHVFDNNAYMCTLLTKEDLENVIVDPEAAAGDTTDPLGELSGFIEVFVWKDDGNGNWDAAETQIANSTLGSLNFFPIAEPPNPVIASTDNFIGIAWCFGDLIPSQGNPFACNGVGNFNTAQSDILNETVRFYVEQARNNPNFSCANVTLR